MKRILKIKKGETVMNVVIWARVSSREQKEGYSIDAQLRVTRDRAHANGW
jgi:DNA invertase Pin-like site-specific DNA recombinase